MIDQRIGQQVSNYQITERIAHGSFGVVYKAKRLVTGHLVAIKFLHEKHLSSKMEYDSFIKEAKLLGDLKHPFILPFFDVGIAPDGVPYFVMEYASGGTLANRLRSKTRSLPEREILSILSQIGQALQYLHEKGIIYCDLKPDNILFNAQGEALLADFGVALVMATLRTHSVERMFGTPAYMAPEQFREKASLKSDQYSLGCIAYELFTGERPFIANNGWVMMYKHDSEMPVPPTFLKPYLLKEVEQAILKAMAKRTEDRFANISAFIEALTAPFLEPTVASPKTPELDDQQDIHLQVDRFHPPIEELLNSFPLSNYIGILREYNTGLSNPSVFAVRYRSVNKYGLDGTFLVKIGSENWAESQRAFYDHLLSNGLPSLFAPISMCSQPVDGLTAVAYEVAFDSLSTSQSLMGILHELNGGSRDEEEAQEQVSRLSQVLVDWYLNPHIAKPGKVDDPHSLLRRMLQPHWRSETLLERLRETLPSWKPDALWIRVDGHARLLPNPLPYLEKMTWLNRISYKMFVPCSGIHGDLYTGNVICSPKTEQIPILIDPDHFLDDGIPFFDLAYLEFDIMRQVLSVEHKENRQRWLSLLDFSMIDILPNHEAPLRSVAFAWKFIRHLRQGVRKLQVASGKYDGDDFAWWLSTVAVGLNFARKGKTRSQYERMAGLLYAAYGMACIYKMFRIEELGTEEILFVPWIQGRFSDATE